MRVGERGEGQCREGEAGEGHRGRDRQQRAVAAKMADEGHDRVDERERERQDEGKMAGLDDHR